MSKEPPEPSIDVERKALHAHLINVMGKLGVRDNFLPRVSIDLASIHKLEFEETPAGVWARIKVTHHEMGS